MNCSYCHSDAGTVPAQWDARSQITLADTGMVNGVAVVGVNLLKQWIEQELPQHLSYAAWRESFFGPAPSSGGEMTTDFDEDGPNQQEFLMRTHPRVADIPAATELEMIGNQVKITLPELTGRSVILETSANLQLWKTWQSTANQGLPRAAGFPAEFSITKSPDSRFFRVKVEER